jgi:hypothetical protein
LNISTANIKILDVGNGTSKIRFFSNPIPRATDTYKVDFYYALDYGQYIGDLSIKLNELKEQLK